MELQNNTTVTLVFEVDGKRHTLTPGSIITVGEVKILRIYPDVPARPKRAPVKKKLKGAPVNERLKALVMRTLETPEEDVIPSANLIYDLNADTVGLLTFFLGLEEEFGVTVPDTAAEEMETLGDVEEWLHSKRLL